MNIRLSLNELFKKVRKIAVEGGTTLTALVRAHSEELTSQLVKSGRERRKREALERTFRRFRFDVGKKMWNREDLHTRSQE